MHLRLMQFKFQDSDPVISLLDFWAKMGTWFGNWGIQEFFLVLIGITTHELTVCLPAKKGVMCILNHFAYFLILWNNAFFFKLSAFVLFAFLLVYA